MCAGAHTDARGLSGPGVGLTCYSRRDAGLIPYASLAAWLAKHRLRRPALMSPP
jgi:hypothetical protein